MCSCVIMEHESERCTSEWAAHIEDGNVTRVNDDKNRSISLFRLLQLDVEGNPAQNGCSTNETLSCHCLICNVALCDSGESSHNVFGQLKTSDLSRVSVFEKVGQILNRNLHSINLHSEVVCGRCFNLLTEYEKTKCRLQRIRLDLLTKFETTENKHKEETVRELLQNQLELEDNNQKCNANGKTEHNDVPLLVITDEGKVVDRNGREKETPAIRRIRSSGTRSLTNGAKLKRYMCSVCGKGFHAFSHRVEHMLIHLGEKPWSCGECKKSFRTKSALRVHSTKHSGERPYACHQCGKSFFRRYYFEEHRRIHSGERPFICTYCQRPFARKKDLVIHTKSHTGDKPHKCTSCPKTFAVKSRLDRHSRIHSGEKPHHCAYCVKSFSRRDDYKVHMRLHTGERPFCCAVCNRTFTHQSNYLAHIRIHKGSKQQYQCPVCGQSFNQRSKTDRHIKMHHRDVSNAQELETKARDATEPPAVQVMDAEIGNLTPVLLQHVAHVQVESLDTSGLSHPDSVSPAIPQPLLHAETLQSLNVTDLHTLQTLPITQVAQLEWSDGTAAGTTTTYVNITPGTFVNIMN